jgi:hypothetical protein
MSMDKAIAHGKEHRKGYRERGKPGRYDLSCRPHGRCGYCMRSRLRWRKVFAQLAGINDAHLQHDYTGEEFVADVCTPQAPCWLCRNPATQCRVNSTQRGV